MFYYSKTTNCSYKKTVDRFCFYTNLSTVPLEFLEEYMPWSADLPDYLYSKPRN